MMFRTKREHSVLLWLAGIGLALLTPWIALAQNTVDEEHLKKASFLSGLPAYGGWPTEAFASQTSPFGICVYKDWAFANALKEMSRSFSFSGHPVEVRMIEKEQEIKDCQILWVGQPNDKKYSEYSKVLSWIHKTPVLAVGEDTIFTELGGAIAIGYDHQAKRPTVEQIHGEHADAARVRISSKLMKMAHSYVSPPPPPPPSSNQ